MQRELTHIRLASFLWDTSHKVSDQGLHCLLTENSIEIRIKLKKIAPKARVRPVYNDGKIHKA